MEVAAGGIVFLTVGVIVLFFGLRPLHPKAPHASVLIATMLAVALHAYENFAREDPSALIAGVFAWSLVPYALCLLVASLSKSWIVLFDVKVHKDLCVNAPTNSTAGRASLRASLEPPCVCAARHACGLAVTAFVSARQ